MTLSTLDIALDGGEHAVLFYERDAQLVSAVAAFVADALLAGATPVVIATGAHREALRPELAAVGVDAASAGVVWLDAADTLARLMPAGAIDADAFAEVVGGTVRVAGASGAPARVFGEMVSLLWERGDVGTAIALEERWNEVVAEQGCALLCAYRSAQGPGPPGAVLGQVCALHSCVLVAASDGAMRPSAGEDVPGHGVVSAGFCAEREAPGAARRFVVETISRWGCEGMLLENAQLAVTELAANAVIHAGSPFSVTLSRSRRGVRLSVRDESPHQPVVRQAEWSEDSGLGLRLIERLASEWGVEPAQPGKIVWVELQP